VFPPLIPRDFSFPGVTGLPEGMSGKKRKIPEEIRQPVFVPDF
jgi:hypothetical protein